MKCSKYILLAAVAALPLAIAQADAKTVTETYTYSYDKNHDGIITSDEFSTYVYQRSDLDADTYLTTDEFDFLTNRWYKPYDVKYETYTYWDQDKDNRLDANEVETIVAKSGLYSKWDSDLNGELNNAEFAAGTFKAYDDNGDGNITITEWSDVVQ
jgi:hypothetical protein